jgi:hypothetical protein
VQRRLYLDSRDLIELVANDRPVTVAAFADLLRQKDWSVVYSYANVCETTIPGDLRETARRAALLNSIPHIFIRAMPPIRCMEFRAATRAFGAGLEPVIINPYVEYWFEAFLYPEQDAEMSAVRQFAFEQQVLFMVKNSPDVCRNLPEQTAEVQSAVDKDRTVTDPVRRNRERFEGGVAVTLAECGLSVPTAEKRAFARWIRENPARCPGWRLFDEGYLKFASNVSDSVDHGDSNDWSHVTCLPYVDAITLDRRIAGYARAAADNLHRQSASCSYSERIFKDVENWLHSA